jgi:hypothetical protein
MPNTAHMISVSTSVMTGSMVWQIIGGMTEASSPTAKDHWAMIEALAPLPALQ